MPISNPVLRRDLPYTYTAIVGLLVMAFHQMGLGVLDPAKVLNGPALAQAFPQIWPYLVLCAGVAAQRRWARDLAAPVAFCALVAALAVLPHTEFLNLGLQHQHPTLGPDFSVWRLLKRQMAVQGLQILLCGGAFYALTRPELISACAKLQEQPDWTLGLGFAGLLLLGWEFFAASQAVDAALYRFAAWSGKEADWEALGLALLALLALIGLWKRRWWGWLASGIQTLALTVRLSKHALATAQLVFSATQTTAPQAAPYAAAEAFSRRLPDLSVLVCALAAWMVSKSQFKKAEQR